HQWTNNIHLDHPPRRISLSINQAAEGGEMAEEYPEHYDEHAYDDEGNYIGPTYDASAIESAWEEYEKSEGGDGAGASSPAPEAPDLPQSAPADHPPSPASAPDIDAE